MYIYFIIITANPPQEDVISLRLSSSSEDSIPLVVVHNRIEGKLSNNFDKPPDTATSRDVVDMNALGEAGLSTSITDVTHFSEYPIDLETQMSAYITDPLNATIDLDNNDINLEANKIRSEDKNIDEVDISSDSSGKSFWFGGLHFIPPTIFIVLEIFC